MKKTTLSLLALGTLITTGNAAVIAWTASDYVNFSSGVAVKNEMGIDQFAQTGSLVRAVNLGGFDRVLTQMNDGNISFQGTRSGTTITNFSTSGFDGARLNGFHAVPGTNPDHGGPNNEISYSALTGTGRATVTFSGLIPGNQYRIQALVMDGQTDANGRTTTFDSTNLGVYGRGIQGSGPGATWGDGLLATGTFVADSAVQSFSQQIFSSGGTSAGSQLNAITLYNLGPVPEPSSLLLFGVGSLGLLRRRR